MQQRRYFKRLSTLQSKHLLLRHLSSENFGSRAVRTCRSASRNAGGEIVSLLHLEYCSRLLLWSSMHQSVQLRAPGAPHAAPHKCSCSGLPRSRGVFHGRLIENMASPRPSQREPAASALPIAAQGSANSAHRYRAQPDASHGPVIGRPRPQSRQTAANATKLRSTEELATTAGQHASNRTWVSC